MKERINELRGTFKGLLASVTKSQELEDLRVKFLGKKGALQELMISLKEAPPELRPTLGKEINTLKEEIISLCDLAQHGFAENELAKQIESERIDVSLPGRCRFQGKRHPLTAIMEKALELLEESGFVVQYGPDIDSDYYNFEGLNIPENHPARDMQDTFYVSPGQLLRSHTSNTQLRVMEKYAPPIRMVAPGTVFRNEDISARSHVFFHQIEGLYIDKGVSFSSLFAIMERFWRKLFEKPDLELRFRPSYFPFVEPGLEIDIACTACNGSGCRICKHSGWLEVGGAGMVHPEVLKNGGIDPEIYSGYAWGLGIERVAMLLFGIKDIRLFSENEMRLLHQTLP